jgi:hypothetical protein
MGGAADSAASSQHSQHPVQNEECPMPKCEVRVAVFVFVFRGLMCCATAPTSSTTAPTFSRVLVFAAPSPPLATSHHLPLPCAANPQPPIDLGSPCGHLRMRSWSTGVYAPTPPSSLLLALGSFLLSLLLLSFLDLVRQRLSVP